MRRGESEDGQLRRVEKPPLTCSNGAEDGIRTRDPHLGKVMRYRCATSALGTTLSRPRQEPTKARRTGARARLRARRGRPNRRPRLARFPTCTRTRPRPSSAAPSVRSPTSTTGFVRTPRRGTRLAASEGADRRPRNRCRHRPPDPAPGRTGGPRDRGRARRADAGRACAPRTAASTSWPGQAEEIPAADSSYDVVIAASAWHWVDEERAVPEVARVLRPGGRLSLVWSGPDRSVDWMRSLWAGGIVFSPERADDVDTGGGAGTWSTSTPPAPARSSSPRRALPLDPAHDEGRPRRARRHLQRRHHHGRGGRRQHLDAMRRFLDTHEPFSGLDVIDVPMRSYCWRATKR